MLFRSLYLTSSPTIKCGLLRIGLATAKGLSLAAGLPVIPVSTLATLAHNFAAGSHLVVPVLNARKHEVYAGFFRVQSSFPEAVAPEQALSPAEAAAAIKQLQRTLHLSAVCMPGDGFEPYRELWTEALGGDLISIPTALSRPRAGALASLAVAKAERGEFGDIFKTNAAGSSANVPGGTKPVPAARRTAPDRSLTRGANPSTAANQTNAAGSSANVPVKKIVQAKNDRPENAAADSEMKKDGSE